MSETDRDYPIRVTLKAGSGYDAPWVTIGGNTSRDIINKMEQNEGADLMELMQTVSGAGKAFNSAWTGKDLPEARTQGKPQGADAPSPQKGQDPFNPKPVEDDAPPFGKKEDPNLPQCKHGPRTHRPHKGVDYWVCASDLPKGHPDRCDPIVE